MKKPDIFHAIDAPLGGSNLIEASAGTGKTYSIAILVLRLLLEKELLLKEILMVTFTKAAVAELETRIRLFVREAGKASEDLVIEDKTISSVVRRAVESKGKDKVRELLKSAVLLLDDTSVMTIHSFCQQTLSEFAFETGQLFGADTLEDINFLVMEEVNKFWRSHVTSIPVGLLKVLRDHGLTREYLSEVLNAHFSGKRFISYRDGSDFSVEPGMLDDAWRDISGMLADAEISTDRLYDRIRNNEGGIREATLGDRYAKKGLGDLLDDPQAFVEKLKKSRSSGYVIKLYTPLLELIDDIDQVHERVRVVSENLIGRFYSWSIQLAGSHMTEFKNRNGVLSFDDMITNLHRSAVSEENEGLREALRQKYKAVFVDEFQDTDRMQYEIFRRVFGAAAMLFYIGDPKQSIYGWRKADITTYLNAGKDVGTRYEMNVNFRSSSSYISAMNLFFRPRDDFDTFGFAGGEIPFDYIPVIAPENVTKKGLLKKGADDAPLKILECKNNSEIAGAVALQVQDLLENKDWQLQEGDCLRRIVPSDIGILVRTNVQASEIKRALFARGVPSINIDETRILDTEEARRLLFLLMAMGEPGRGSIHKALLSPFTGFDREKLSLLNMDEMQERFRTYGMLWRQHGIYVAMQMFLHDFAVHSVLLNDQHGYGERMLANLIQLIEILHKIQSSRQFNNGELIAWLQKGTEGMRVEGNEFEQRVESDEDAVRIITIHKSKGLEYNIVFAPFLDFHSDGSKSSKHFFCSFRDPGSGDYLFERTNHLTDAQAILLNSQLEQENRRLVYVAVTRAVFACFVFRNTYFKQSSLEPFVTAIKSLPSLPPAVCLMAVDQIPLRGRYAGKRSWMPLKRLPLPDVMLRDAHWHKLSYTFLAKKHPYVMKDDSHSVEDAFNRFVFKQLPRGNVAGNMLHYILENIDFVNDRQWEGVVASGIRRFIPGLSDSYNGMIISMLDHVVHALITVGGDRFTLSEVGRNQRVSEFEFDFPVNEFVNTDLKMLANEELVLDVDYEQPLAGLMNGKIDLVFSHAGKYYILDWKSNFLGDEMTYYSPSMLLDAMNESNYHLQYLLYTLALRRYLSLKLPDFNYERDFGGVIYVFLRGIRKKGDHGIFTARPAVKQIDRLEGILLGEANLV